MQKVFLLLRSNKQTGPYSLEELLQLNLKPFDLVWQEGRSAAWQYPFEIPALKPYVPETPQAEVPFQPIATSAMDEKAGRTSIQNFQSQPQDPNPPKTEAPKRVFVSVPKTYTVKEQNTYASNEDKSFVAEHKAFMPPVDEPLYQRTEEVKPSSYIQQNLSAAGQKPVSEESVHTNYSRSLNEVEENYTNWVYQQKTKKKTSVNPKDLVLVLLILAVIGGGYYVMSKPSLANSVLPANKSATQANQLPAGVQPEETEPKEILTPEQRLNPNTAHHSANGIETKQPKNIKTKNPLTVSHSQTNSSVPQVQNSMPVEKTTPNIHSDDNNITSKEPEVKQQEKLPAEKKKKLGDVLKGIFTKKEKKEEPKNDAPVLEEPKPANNRQATRRDDANTPDDNPGTNEISTASLIEQVDLSSNAPENWMMGVKNLKISLKNRSSVTIQAASVTVSYYDENSQLLDKKLIYFSNVAPKSRATVAAPDHKFADHVEFKLTTITAKEDRYARY